MTDHAPPSTVAPSWRTSGLFGVGRADVTPPQGIFFRNWGAATEDVAAGIHKPFLATALTVREAPGADPLVLVGVDGGWWQDAADEWFVRSGVLEALDLDPSRVIVNLSHTHAGPSLVRDNAGKPGGEWIAPYLERMRDAVVQATRAALASERPGELRWATGRSDVATNRSRRDPDRDRFVTGYEPANAADDTVLVGRVSADDGTSLGTIVNYACHPTTLAWDNRYMSPDYVGAMRETVEENTGGVPCLFLLGACGELAPAYQYVGDVAVADRLGRRLGLSAVAALESLMPHGTQLAFDRIVESGAPLAVWSPVVAPPASRTTYAEELVLDLPIKRDYPSMASIEADLSTATEGFEIERLSRRKRLRTSLGDGDTYPLHVWSWRIGDTHVIGWPGEAFSAAQTQLRAAFPHLAIVVMNVVNGTIGYLPPEHLYDEDMYEVWQTPLDRGCFEALLAAAHASIARGEDRRP